MQEVHQGVLVLLLAVAASLSLRLLLALRTRGARRSLFRPEVWRPLVEAAPELMLSTEGLEPRVHGSWRGWKVQVVAHTVAARKGRSGEAVDRITRRTRLSMVIDAALPPDLRIRSASWSASLRRLFEEGTRQRSGDAQLDRRLIILSRHGRAVEGLLRSEELRAALSQLAALGKLHLNGRALRLEHPGLASAAEVERGLDALVHTASLLRELAGALRQQARPPTPSAPPRRRNLGPALRSITLQTGPAQALAIQQLRSQPVRLGLDLRSRQELSGGAVELRGPLRGSSVRVELHCPAEHRPTALEVGGSLQAEGLVESYEPSRRVVRVSATSAPRPAPR